MKSQNQEGFALLISLIVVGVVISVGLTILELSITQVRLSDNAKQSELAFHAANAGVECGRYWRRAEAEMMLAPTDYEPIDVSCFGEPADDIGRIEINSGDDPGEIEDAVAYLYEYEFSWGTEPRCTKISNLVITEVESGGATLHGVSEVEVAPAAAGEDPGLPFRGFPEEDSTCEEAQQCTIMAVRGYNKGCVNIDTFGTTEREVLLQF